MRRLSLVASVLLAACGTSERTTGLAMADTTALVCEPVLQPSGDDDGRIEGFAPGPNGMMAWTTDFGASEIRVGRSLAESRAIGRSGAGPGEFKMLYTLGWHGDSLWATDFQLSRVQFFSADGRYLFGTQLSGQQPWTPRPDGRFVALGSKGIGLGGWGLLGTLGVEAATDSLYHFPGPSEERITIPMGNGSSIMSTQPFAAQAVAAGSPNGERWCGVEPLDGDRVRLRCVDDRGGVQRDTTFALAGIPLDDATWEAKLADLTGSGRVTREAVLGVVRRPAMLPRVTAMRVDPNGGVWLNRSAPGAPIQRWLRLTTTGSVRDTLLLSGRHTIRHLSGDTVWLATPDADDAITISRCVAAQ